MRTGISRRWAACIGAAVVLGVAGLGVWSANADTAPDTNNTDTVWTVDGSTQSPQEAEKNLDTFLSKIRGIDTVWT